MIDYRTDLTRKDALLGRLHGMPTLETRVRLSTPPPHSHRFLLDRQAPQVRGYLFTSRWHNLECTRPSTVARRT